MPQVDAPPTQCPKWMPPLTQCPRWMPPLTQCPRWMPPLTQCPQVDAPINSMPPGGCPLPNGHTDPVYKLQNSVSSPPDMSGPMWHGLDSSAPPPPPPAADIPNRYIFLSLFKLMFYVQFHCKCFKRYFFRKTWVFTNHLLSAHHYLKLISIEKVI